MILDGRAIATIKDENDTEKTVMKYGEGDYFGERALLQNEPRAASIIAKTRLQTVKIDKACFNRLLGPLDDILRRNMENYNKFSFISSGSD